MKQRTHTTLTIFGATALALGLAACGDSGTVEPQASATTTSESSSTESSSAESTTPEETAPTTVTETAAQAGHAESSPAEGIPAGGEEGNGADNSVDEAVTVPATAIKDFGSGGKWAIFQSPTGNIGCAIGTAVNCELVNGDKAFSIVNGQAQLKQPSEESSYSAAVHPDQENPVTPQVLQYGQTIRYGDYSCTSTERGMTCVDPAHNAGGFLSRDHVETF